MAATGKQVVELNGYVIILVEGRDGKIKLYGSPAEKDNLEVADEILDVNERKLEDLSRTEVIRHIHECIQSCMIKLRVKRRSDSRLAGELGNAVQDAFVIAVEQQARERLQRLSALKRITPVDMSQLSVKLNQQKGGTAQDLSFLKEASPIYVTSLSGNSVTTSSTTAHSGGGAANDLIVADSTEYAKAQQLNSTTGGVAGGLKPLTIRPPGGVNQNSIGGGAHTAQSVGVVAVGQTFNNNSSSARTLNNNLVNSNINVSFNNRAGAAAEVSTLTGAKSGGDGSGGVNLNNNHINNLLLTNNRISDYNNCYETNNNAAPIGGESKYNLANGHTIAAEEVQYPSSNLHTAIKGGTEVLLGEQSLRLDNRPRRKSGTGILFVDEEDPASRYNLEEYLSDNNNPIDLQKHQFNSDIEMLTMLSVNQDNGPHREMAVDVPESFIARNKTPPRYPPRPMQNPRYNTNDRHSTTEEQQTATTNNPKSGGYGELIKFPTANHLNTIGNKKKSKKSEAMEQMTSENDDEEHGLEMVDRQNSVTSSTAASIKKLEVVANEKRQQPMLLLPPPPMLPLKPKPKTMSTSSSTTDSTSDSFNDLNGALPGYNFCDESSMMTESSFIITSAADESGPHRELPVDVPDSFVGTIKQAPRYPQMPKPSISTFKPIPTRPKESAIDVVPALPPRIAGGGGVGRDTLERPQSHSSGGHMNESFRNAKCINMPHKHMQPQPQTPVIVNNKVNGSAKPVPPPRDHLRVEKDGRLINIGDRNYNQSTGAGQIAQVIEPTHEQEMSIKKFQEQLRRRKEEEERIAQENEFLRASLRGSRKLQALQDGPLPQERPTGIENDAFLEDDEVPERPIVGYGDFVTALQRLQAQLNKSGMTTLSGRVAAAQTLLLGPGVARALATRAAVLQRRRPRISNPVTANAQLLAKDCVETLTQSNSSDAIELCDLLSTYEMEGIFQAHDRIAANTDRSPAVMTSSSPMPMKLLNHTTNPILQNNINKTLPQQQQRDSLAAASAVPLGILRDGGGQDHIRIIQIEKSSEPLGATIRNEGEAIVIGRIVRGGAAEKSGLLHEGDEVLEVNGTEMRGKSVNDVCAILAQMVGTLTFLIVPAGSPPPGGGALGREQVLHVRAHFDYDPEDDLYIPCRELGISFQKGDVLHVISRDDPNWWQAYREGEEDQTLAGLIPSQQFQHQRETMKLAIAGESGRGKETNVKGATLLCARKGRKKKKKTSSEAGYPLYATTTSEDPEPEEILTYEEVSLYYPRASHKRPIVLIGPQSIGRHELRQRLMTDSERFAAAVPHTSRPQREGEVPGQDYHFITRAQFEADILGRKFVEHGEYEKAYYGTSLEAIRAVVASGKICVLNLHPQSLKLLRSSDLKPYVVLVAPPSLEKLRLKKIRSGEPFKEDELKEIIATARDMEARWGHLFDMIIINNETERAYTQLLTEINSLEREPQWVPSQWIHS